MKSHKVNIIGGGLAGSEAAWQLAQRGVHVNLFEMRPKVMTDAHHSDGLAELVCSNSFRSEDPLHAAGLLKHEMRALDSLIMQAADANRVPAGGAHAVDRNIFSQYITKTLSQHPNIQVHQQEVTDLDFDEPTIVATGPLTSTPLADALAKLLGQERLYFFDAIAPIIEADSVNRDIVFAASRYGKGDGDDYLNCPMNKDEYEGFIDALLAAEKMEFKDFEKDIPYFEGCLPIEEMAERGRETLRFGPLKPVGLTDPRTDRWPHAVVQLRKENAFASLLNMVGFQTKMKYPEQKRVLKTIPGLENAEFHRMGSLHKNTYINAPESLTPFLQIKNKSDVYIAGQITGVEGYIESTACGLASALFVFAHLNNVELQPPSENTAIGALLRYLREGSAKHFQPMKINFGLFPPIDVAHKSQKKEALVERAHRDLDEWITVNQLKSSRAA